MIVGRGPAPVNYGSTSLNAGPYGGRGSSGDNGPYRQPDLPSWKVHGRGTSDSGGEDRSWRHRVVKKKSGYCSRCCVLFLAVLLYLWYLFGQLDFDQESECVLDDNVHPVVENKTLPLTYGLNLIANFEDGIKGIVNVRQQESLDVDRIEIRLKVRVSTTKLASYIRGSFEVDPSGPTVNYRVRIHNDDKKERERMMKGRCAHAEVVVIYPKMTPHGVGSLTLNSAGCDFTVGKVSGIFDNLSMHCTNGKLSVDSTSVRNRTTFDVTNGQISGMLETSGEVKANINNGQVDLGIDTTPRESGWNANNFDVQIESVNGAISLRLAQPFYGHFSLASRAGAAKVTVPEQRDYVQYTYKKWNAATGWISSVGSQHEPTKPLPRIQQVNVNGAIEMTIKG
ncbi:hypothetical protein BGW38_000009 [Lunasporangiospora selenospora]|uniref:Adhesin domain-containing protein n=1 Tax=Lunasporangiospora selenospora TaxID=979761 RepID=A0A9P6G3B6_9FUNG|nr:hypothetical protein BGW38_000009 [Lunasporangiospora selenospora]